MWTFKYRSAATTYKWEFIGGPPLEAEVTTDESTTSTSYAALATAGPSVTAPLAGDYIVATSSRQYNATAAASDLHSFDIAASGAADADAAFTSQNAASGAAAVYGIRRIKKTALAASTGLVSKYRVSAGTGFFSHRTISITPIRVI